MNAGLYIHIPFCLKRCNYCDFYTFGGNESVPQEYVNAVKQQIDKYSDFTWKTVYFGGGTPGLLLPDQIKYILSELNIDKNAEITLEVNPETASFDKFKGYRYEGINRISMGVQTADNNSLKTIGRIHDNLKVKKAFSDAVKAGFENISGDLMLGLPGYTYGELDSTIEFLSQLGAKHISAYMLKIEKGTPFYKNPPSNLPDEEQMSDFYLYACDKLEQKGYKQYEISNFAKEGYHSRHNCIYWKLENYVGIGPSAHSCVEGKRFYYPKDLKGFLKKPQVIQDGQADSDDYIMLSLRLKSGLNLKEIENKWGIKANDFQLKKLEMLKRNGYITFENDTVSLTPKGFLVENSIACEIMSWM